MAANRQKPPRPDESGAHKVGSTHYDEAAGATPKQAVDPSLAGQERGERIETSKAIARGGKASGHVPGATEPRNKK